MRAPVARHCRRRLDQLQAVCGGGQNLRFKGDGPAGYDFYAQMGFDDPNDPNASLTLGGNTLVFKDTAASPFPNWIDHFDTFDIDWSVSADGGATWIDAGTTKNQVYTFLDTPTTTLYHTVAHLATAPPAKGLTDPAAVVDAIWTQFSDNEVRRVVDPLETLMNPAAEGFVRTLAAHAIEATSTSVDPPGDRFAVKAMPAQGSGGADYVVGTLADGGFNFHEVVRVTLYANRIYDPSYGVLTIKSDGRSVELKYEDDNVTHFRDGPSNWMANVLGDALQLIFTP